MSASNGQNDEDSSNPFVWMTKLLRRTDTLQDENVSVAREAGFDLDTSFGVVGLLALQQGLPPDLTRRISVQGASSCRQLKRTLVITGVDSIFQPIAFLKLSVKFGRGFDRFLLLNEVAVEACEAAKLNFTILGYIKVGNVPSYSNILTCPYWS